MPRPKKTDEERLWSRVRIGAPNECWPYVKENGEIPEGYGQTKLNGAGIAASRAAWILTRGPIPPKQLVCHKCDNRACCNPEHLFLGDHHDNSIDARRKGRAGFGGKKKLDVLLIRAWLADGYPHKAIAQAFGVHPVTISKISCGAAWSWLGGIEDVR